MSDAIAPTENHENRPIANVAPAPKEAKKRARIPYGKELKLTVVKECLAMKRAGETVNMTALAKKYNVRSSQLCKDWVEKFEPILMYPEVVEENQRLCAELAEARTKLKTFQELYQH